MIYIHPKIDYYNIGARISVEYYDYISLDVDGGRESGGLRILDYNLFARHTIKESVFWFSVLGVYINSY